MISLEFVNQFMYENMLLTTVSSDGRSFNCRCPYCGDSKKSKVKKRFHLKYKDENSIYFNCFNCGKTGTFVDLVSFIKNISKADVMKLVKKITLSDLSIVLHKKKREKEKDEIKKDNKEFSNVLVDCLSLKTEPEGYIQKVFRDKLDEFYSSRCIDKNFPLYIAYKGEWKNRIIIPIYDEDKLIYFQGRAISDIIQPKYKNPIAEKRNIILNKNRFDKNKFIIITEGILDSLSIGSQGTVCLGSKICDNFLKNLFELTDSGVIIALDNDLTGMKSMLKISKESKYKNNLRFFLMPNKYKKVKDLNEFKIKMHDIDMYQFILDNSNSSFEAQVKLKLI